jgi:uncharacterized membrane protein HdeD (DUF308 family)
VTGLLQVIGAWRLRREIKGEWLFLATGALTLLLGLGLLVIFFIAPAPTLLSVAWFIGIWALASGIALLMLAYRLRRHAHG